MVTYNYTETSYMNDPVYLTISLIIAVIIADVKLAKAFGKGAGFALGLIFLSVIFLPILGFGSAQYQGAQ